MSEFISHESSTNRTTGALRRTPRHCDADLSERTRLLQAISAGTSDLLNNGQLDVRRRLLRAIHLLCSLHVIVRFRRVDTAGERLWIAINHWKPGGLHLNHDAVIFQEDVIAVAKRYRKERGLIWFQ